MATLWLNRHRHAQASHFVPLQLPGAASPIIRLARIGSLERATESEAYSTMRPNDGVLSFDRTGNKCKSEFVGGKKLSSARAAESDERDFRRSH
jgi:hypothetical protein